MPGWEEGKSTVGQVRRMVNTPPRFLGGGRTLPDLELLIMLLRPGCVHVKAQSAYHDVVQ